MRTINFDNDELYSPYAFNYVTHKMIEMVEQESKTVNDLSCYRWVIGDRVAKSIFPKRPTKIFDYDVVYGDPVKFYSNGINFEVGDISSGYSYLDTDTAFKIEELNSRVRHMDVDSTELIKKHLNRIYGTINVSELYQKQLIQLPITDYNKMNVKKEDKKMDIKLYYFGTFVGGIVTNPQYLIKNVIFSGPCTIVQWSDGDKTIVRCENEDFDKEKGLAMAIVKKLFGTNESKSNYNDIFKKWLPKEEDHEYEEKWFTVSQFAEKFGMSKSTIQKQCRNGIFEAKKVNGKWMIPFKTFK